MIFLSIFTACTSVSFVNYFELIHYKLHFSLIQQRCFDFILFVFFWKCSEKVQIAVFAHQFLSIFCWSLCTAAAFLLFFWYYIVLFILLLFISSSLFQRNFFALFHSNQTYREKKWNNIASWKTVYFLFSRAVLFLLNVHPNE